MAEKLNRQDWIDRALRMLALSGVETVRVEPLAKALGVTKGSFYWHFRDRTALLEAMLDAWRERTTDAVIEHVEAAGGDAPTRLASLFRLTVQSEGRLERAIRSWAATDEAARAALAGVDARRIGYLLRLFQEIGLSPEAALSRARLAYLALIGQYMIKADQPDWLAESLDEIVPMMTRPLAG